MTEELHGAFHLGRNQVCNVRPMYTQNNCTHKMAAAAHGLFKVDGSPSFETQYLKGALNNILQFSFWLNFIYQVKLDC